MKLNVYTTYDSAAKFYSRPWYAHNDDVALRSFKSVCMDSKTDINASPTDFSLFWIGTYDDETSELQWQIPVCIAKAHEVVAMAGGHPPPISNKPVYVEDGVDAPVYSGASMDEALGNG